MDEDKRFRLAILIFVVGSLLVFSWYLGLYISRVGKYKVRVYTFPSIAELYVDGKQEAPNEDIYLSGGKHKFVAKYSAFDQAEKNLDINKNQVITLITRPTSKEAQDELSNNKDLQTEYQKFGDEEATNTQNTLNDKYPFLNQLPVIGVRGFEIYKTDPLNSVNKNAAIALEVLADNPDGRKKAVDTIRNDLGYDPTNIEFVFDNQNNIFDR